MNHLNIQTHAKLYGAKNMKKVTYGDFEHIL